MSVQTLLELEEGREHYAYPDPLTKGAPWTIGIGHTGPDVKPGDVWTDAQIDVAFAQDLRTATQACETYFGAWLHRLNDAREAVLISMMFQMGPARVLKFVNTLKAIEDGRFSDASDGMLASAWARQTPKRVIRAAQQMKTGVWDPQYLNKD